MSPVIILTVLLAFILPASAPAAESLACMKSDYRAFQLQDFSRISLALASMQKFGFCSDQTIATLNTAFKQNQSSRIAGLPALLRYADKLLDEKVFPKLGVTQSQFTPPSGDNHDYASIMLYAWPSDPNDLKKPWVTHDGKINTGRTAIAPDSEYLAKTMSRIQVSSTAFAVTGNSKYASRGVDLLKSWFIDPSTKMNPNLNFAQSLPGSNDGTNFGIIEGIPLTQILDDEAMLETSGLLSASDIDAFKKWMTDYEKWLRTSPNGIKEAQAKNNHGTWYRTQLAALDYYLGKIDDAKATIESVKTLIASQILPDGSMPEEIKRTRPLHYSVYNLNALTELALLGDKVGVDLWNYKTLDGRSIKKAVDYVSRCVPPGDQCGFKTEGMKIVTGSRVGTDGIELWEPENALQILVRANSLDSSHPYGAKIGFLKNTVKDWNIDPQILCEPE